MPRTRRSSEIGFFCWVLVALVLLSCGGSRGDNALIPKSPSGGVYLALGDSIAAGTGASDPATTSYAALTETALKQRLGESLQLKSLATGGHTTQDLIDKQLQPALETLRGGDVRLVTLTIGGNDMYQYGAYPPCLVDPAAADCPLGAGLVTVEQHLDQILNQLHAASPKTVVVIEQYPDLFSGSGNTVAAQAKTAFGLLNDVIARVAQRNGVLLADPRAAFEGRSQELTHGSESPAFHPNDAGHRLIADAFLKVLRLPSSDGTPEAR